MTESAEADRLKTEQESLLAHALQQWRDHLDGRVVVVTGGARGLGRVMAEGLLAAGASVASADKSWQGEEELQERLNASDRGLAVEMDVTDGNAVDAALWQVLAKFKTVDVLVNNAGLVSETLFPPHGHVKALDTADEDWEAMFRVNVFGAMKVTRRFVRPMIDRRRGSILNMVSSGVLMNSLGGAFFGARPWTVEMPYQATKSALTTLTFYLAEELRENGISVTAMMPGHTRASWFDDTARAFHEGGAIYALRPLRPEHVLPLVYFLSAQPAQTDEPVSGRLYHVPDWNYDHGYGDVRVWGDRSLPEDLDREYRRLEAALPDYWRAGLARAPFDVERVVYGTTMAKIAVGDDE